VPCRCAPGFGEIRNSSVPFPLRVPVNDGTIQLTALDTDHEHAGSLAFTVTLTVSPAPFALALVGLTSNVHPSTWETANGRPAIVSVVDRGGTVDALASYWTVPGPLPDAPDVTLIHEAPLLAVHGQPAAVVTETLPFDPAAGIEMLVGASEYEQPAA
jgi:hypothetical protein